MRVSGKKPTLQQKRIIGSIGYNPNDYLVVKVCSDIEKNRMVILKRDNNETVTIDYDRDTFNAVEVK